MIGIMFHSVCPEILQGGLYFFFLPSISLVLYRCVLTPQPAMLEIWCPFNCTIRGRNGFGIKRDFFLLYFSFVLFFFLCHCEGKVVVCVKCVWIRSDVYNALICLETIEAIFNGNPAPVRLCFFDVFVFFFFPLLMELGRGLCLDIIECE
ncbi:hypothetical protein ACQKWADRAFT_58852 [Trichoderma austrokoningii]